MKRFFVFAALAAFALTSCEQKIDVPAVMPTPGGSESTGLVFTATTESSATKTALSENGGNYDVVWQSGDQITIVDGAATPNVGKYTTTSTTTEATFTVVPESGTEAATSPFKAWYPASIYNDGTPTLPATQNYVEGNISGAPMFASSSTTSLKFKNLGGIICLNLSTSLSDISVASISLSATQPMSGPISNVASLSSETPVAATVSGLAGVTLNCGAGVAINGTAKPFYIAVPAGEYTGLSIAVTTTTGAGQTFTLKSDKSIVVGRSQITVISLTANNIHTTYNLTDGNVTVPDGETATVTGSSNDHTLTIGAGANVTLQNTRSRQIITQGDATLTLVGDNVVAPITINRFNAIIPADNSTLTINGTGSLDCTRWDGGTMNYCIDNNTADLIIDGGQIIFKSSMYRSPSAVVVHDYTQTAGTVDIIVGSNNNDGNSYPAGLSAMNDILISGGSISSTGSVAIYAGHDMEISGGTVVAEGNFRHYNGAVGLSAVGTLTISGGTVTATGSGGIVTGPGIGTTGTCGDIVITGGNITASGSVDYNGRGSAGIGTSSTGGTCGNITVHSGIVRLAVSKGNSSAQAPIGKGNASSTVGTITIDGVENPTAESFFTGLSLVVSNGGNTWTLTPSANTPTSLSHLKDMINAGKDVSAYLGRYVYSDGSFGTNATDAIGRLAYFSTKDIDYRGIEGARMLVVALNDIRPEGYDNCDNAKAAATSLGLAISDQSQTQWRIPSSGMWNDMTAGLGKDGTHSNGDFYVLCSAVGLSTSLKYWTTSQETSNLHRYYYCYATSWDYSANRLYFNFSDPPAQARACFAY
jgi:hypothetical protein